MTVVQFLKDGQSSELDPLRRLGAVVYSGQPGMKFVFQMNEAEKAAARQEQNDLLRQALDTPCDLLVLDEACAALSLGMVEEALLRRAVLDRPAGREICLTGRDPAPWLREAADYLTEMRCLRHPYDAGVPARRGWSSEPEPLYTSIKTQQNARAGKNPARAFLGLSGGGGQGWVFSR